MPNDRYIPALWNFGTLDYFQAEDVAAYNPGDVPFGAFALITIAGSLQNATVDATPVAPQFIWGNLDSANSTGWGFALTAQAQVPELSAFINGVQIIHPLDSSGPAVQWAERLMLVGLWYDGVDCYMTINGTIVQAPQVLGAPYAPSALFARVGQNPDDGVDSPLLTGYVHSVGYTNVFTPDVAAPVPDPVQVSSLAALNFRACMEDLKGSYLVKAGQGDWIHRHNVGALGGGGVVTKSPQGAIIGGASSPLAAWPDEGNQQFLQPAPAVTPQTLVAVTDADTMQVDAHKNPEWYHGGVFDFIAAGL